MPYIRTLSPKVFKSSGVVDDIFHDCPKYGSCILWILDLKRRRFAGRITDRTFMMENKNINDSSTAIII